MKNINKVLAVILTVALLASALVMAVPASAKITSQEISFNDSWGDAPEYPDLVQGTQTNIFTIAADGTTMFMWTPVSTAISANVAAGATTITVSSTEGFPASGTFSLSAGTEGVVDAAVAYASKTPTSFTGITAATVTSAHTIDQLTLVTPPGSVFPTVTASGATFAAALYKSTDAGLTWSASGLTVPATAAVPAIPFVITMLKVCPTDTNQLVAATATNLYRSINGGKTWAVGVPVATIDSTGPAAAINSIDIAENSDGNITILAGTDVGVAMFDAALGVWKNTSASTLGTIASWGTIANVCKLAVFSPDFANDNQILAVACNGTNTVLTAICVGDTVWSGTATCSVGLGTLLSSGTTAITAVGGASIAFPSNYSWGTNNQVFVGLTGTTPAGAGDVYRVNGKLGNNAATVKDCGLDAAVTSVAVSGTKSDSTVVASQTLAGAGITFSTDADTGSAPAWSTDGVKSPAAVSKLAMASTGILYAGDADVKNSMFYSSTDFKTFNGISRFEVSNIYKVTYSRGVLSEGRNQPGMYFYKTPASTFEMRYYAATGFQENPAGVRGSSTMYTVLNVTPKQIQKTTDFGLTWASMSTPGNKTPTTLAVQSDSVYWIGYNDAGAYIRSNTGAAIAVGTLTQDPGAITFVGTTGILVGLNVTAAASPALNTNRIASTYAWSNDSGASWTVLGKQDQFPTTTPLAYSYITSLQTIYVVDAAGQLWTWELGVDSEWQKEDALAGITPADLTSIKAITMVSDVMIVVVKKAGVDQIYRSLPGDDFDFRPYPNTKDTQIGGLVDSLSAFDSGMGTFNVKPTLARTLNYPLPAHGTIGVTKLYTDQTIGALTATAPVDNAEVNNPVDLSWNKTKQSGTIIYQYQVARDAEFDLIQVDTVTNNSVTLGVFGGILPTGQKYYWRVRVNNDTTPVAVSASSNDLNSLWSETRSFTVKTIGNVNAEGIGKATSVYPAQGEVGISTTPVLTWGTVASATYNIKIATDSAFTNIVDQKEGLTIALYTPAKTLDQNKTYFWEVQAVSGGIASDWVAFAFTTAVDAIPTGPAVTTAPVTPVYTFNVPTQAPITVTQIPVAPETPAYVWFIIVIGAVLVIAVIVLIVRTRRV